MLKMAPGASKLSASAQRVRVADWPISREAASPGLMLQPGSVPTVRKSRMSENAASRPGFKGSGRHEQRFAGQPPVPGRGTPCT